MFEMQITESNRYTRNCAGNFSGYLGTGNRSFFDNSLLLIARRIKNRSVVHI